jgi:hypothetical protein
LLATDAAGRSDVSPLKSLASCVDVVSIIFFIYRFPSASVLIGIHVAPPSEVPFIFESAIVASIVKSAATGNGLSSDTSTHFELPSAATLT